MCISPVHTNSLFYLKIEINVHSNLKRKGVLIEVLSSLFPQIMNSSIRVNFGLVFQLAVRVTDQRVNQERVDDSVVTINVQRDQFPPVFQNTPYGTSIVDSHAVNTTVYTSVTAVDADLQVCIFDIQKILKCLIRIKKIFALLYFF